MQYWQRKLQRSVTEIRTSPIGRPWPSISGAKGSLAAVPVTRLASRLVQQRDLLDRHALLDALDHVVDRERRDRRGGQRLHLDAGAGDRARLGGERDRALVDVDARVAVDVRERDLVAQRDQVCRAL